MLIEGVDGSITDKGYKGWIPLELLLYTVKRPISIQTGQSYDRIRGHAAASECVITKPLDQSTPLIFKAVTTGKAVPKVHIEFRQTAGTYLQYVLDNVIFSGYAIQSPSDNNRFNGLTKPMELITMSYTSMSMTYTPYNEHNQPLSPIREDIKIGSNPNVPIDVDHVLLCKRPADLIWPLSLFYHHWIKTKKHEAGMGAREGEIPGQGNSAWPYSSTKTVSHAGQSEADNAICEPLPDIDVSCVNNLIQPGQETGLWTLFNQCQTFTSSVLDRCRQ
jgi:type VI secretion system secreted protein Hcp